MISTQRYHISIAAALAMMAVSPLAAQPCLTAYNFVASPPPVGGVYQAGQTVNFCITVSFWNTTSANWFHGLVPTFGAGWDMATFLPGPPPATLGPSTGTWGWWPICTGTAITAIGPVGPGWFFDLDNNGIPGDNFGDFVNGVANWQFCWDITVASGAACVNGADLSVTANIYADSETGSWGSAACSGDPNPVLAATAECCQADAGIGGPGTLCDVGPIVDLFTLLGGTPDPGGTWSDPLGGASSGIIDPVVALPGMYTYTVTSLVPPCSVQSVITISIGGQPDAGVPSIVQLCSTSPAIDLFTQLGGTPNVGGTWTDPGGGAAGALFTPGISVPGIYTYTLVATPPCVNAISTVQVIVNAPPDAGSDAAIALCTNGMPADLFTVLLGSPDLGGSWSGPGALPGGVFDPLAGIPGVYTYTVAGIPPCANAQATVTVSITAQPDAGVDVAIIVCVLAPAFDLFGQLGGTPIAGGAWTGPGGLVFAGIFIPGTSTPGVYTYTVTAPPPCSPASATVTVTTATSADAGVDGNITLCSNDPSIALFAALGGAPDPGGSWTDPFGSPWNGTFDPGLDLDGVYTYSVTALAPCPPDDATVTVTTEPAPDAGIGSSISLCSSSSPVDLFIQLGGTPQATGSWTGPFGGPFAGSYDPSFDPPGAYTYTIPAGLACPGASSAVTVAITTQPDAGLNAAVSVCDDATPFDPLSALGGSPDPGGTWTDPLFLPFTGLFDPTNDPAGDYTYSIAALPPCVTVSSTLSISISISGNAGTGSALALCENDAPIDLFTLLGGAPDATGSWTAPGGASVGSILDPASAAAGIYTYTVAGVAPCPPVSSAITVTIDALPLAGMDNPLLPCADAVPASLFSLLGGGAGPGGSWTSPAGGPFFDPFDPTTDAPGTYTYTTIGTGACTGNVDVAEVLVSIAPPVALAFTITPMEGCVPLTVLITNSSDGAATGSVVWDLGDGTTSSDPFAVSHTYSTPGSFDVDLTIIDTSGCTHILVMPGAVNVHPLPDPTFGMEPYAVTIDDPTVTLTASQQGPYLYFWEITGYGAMGPTVIEHTFPGDLSAEYEVCLTVSDSLGCEATWCRMIVVDDVLTLYVPNAFTPDGDGVNEQFLPVLLGLDPEDYALDIFNRWGETVFTTKEPGMAWNGGIGNGDDLVKQGVYIWRIMARDRFTAERREYFGHVTLLK